MLWFGTGSQAQLMWSNVQWPTFRSNNSDSPDCYYSHRQWSIHFYVVRVAKDSCDGCHGSFAEVYRPLWSRASPHRALLVPLERAGAEAGVGLLKKDWECLTWKASAPLEKKLMWIRHKKVWCTTTILIAWFSLFHQEDLIGQIKIKWTKWI